MTNYLIDRFVVYSVKKGFLHEKQQTIVKFGLELLLTSIIGVVWMIIASAIFRRTFAWIPFILGFAPLRTTAGGFHAATHSGCYCISTCSFIVAVLISINYLIPSWLILLIAVCSFIVVLAFSPVEAANKPLSEITRNRNRKRSIAISAINLVLSSTLLIYKIG